MPAMPSVVTLETVYATIVRIARENQDPEPRVYGTAGAILRAEKKSMEQIRALGGAAVEPLIRASRHRDEAVKIRAFKLLCSFRDIRVSDRMLEALRAEVPLLAMYAIQKLSRDGDERAVGPLWEHIRWLERLVTAPALPFSRQYAENSLNRYFLREAREALEALCGLSGGAPGGATTPPRPHCGDASQTSAGRPRTHAPLRRLHP
jgi:hypothetical protein